MRLLTLYESVIFGESTYSATTVDRLIHANDSCESVLFSESTIHSATGLTFMSQLFVVKQTHFTHQPEQFMNRKLLFSSCMTGNESNCTVVKSCEGFRISVVAAFTPYEMTTRDAALGAVLIRFSCTINSKINLHWSRCTAVTWYKS